MPASLYRQLDARYGPRSARPTRREMLQTTLAAAAGLLVSDHVDASARQRAGKRILIVGGGFAGLAAAHELHAVGYDVHVYEARNRLGGRVLSFHDLAPGKTVEGGAELIGSNHPAWVSYQKKFNLKFIDVTEEDAAFPVTLAGTRLSEKDAEALWDDLDAAYKLLNAAAAPVNADEPWTSPDAANLDRVSVGAWIDAQQALSTRTRQALHIEFTADNGALTTWQSQLGNLAQIKGGGLDRYWLDTEVFRCAGGNDQMARALAAPLPADRVHLRTAVTRISVSADGARVALADGSEVAGDDVVLAVPPSVWNKIAIAPPLPAELRPQMGSNVKYLAVVRSKFWRRARLAPSLFTEGPIHLTWEATDNQPGPGTVLTSFSGATAAEECRSWRPADRANRYLRALETIYRDIAREFVKGRFMDWPGDPWTRASYSFPAPGQVTSIGPILRQGLGHLHFAGEHTSPAFVGYMEGGLESGIRIARRLATRDGVIRSQAA